MTSKIIFGRMVDYYRKENNLTMEGLGNKLGKTKSTVSRWISGERSPKMEEVEQIADLFNTDIGTLIFGFEEKIYHIETIYNKLEVSRQKKVYKFAEKQLEAQNSTQNIAECREERYHVPIHGLLTAGHGSINFDKEQPFASVTVEYVPKDYDLAFEISGDSMLPTFQDGEIVFVQRLQTIYNGMLAAVEINNEAFIKKVYLEGNRIRLVSLNTDLNDSGERLYPDFYADEKDDIHMIGRVLT